MASKQRFQSRPYKPMVAKIRRLSEPSEPRLASLMVARKFIAGWAMNSRLAPRSTETPDEYIFQPLISSVPPGRKQFILDSMWDPSQAAEGKHNLWIEEVSCPLRYFSYNALLS